MRKTFSYILICISLAWTTPTLQAQDSGGVSRNDKTEEMHPDQLLDHAREIFRYRPIEALDNIRRALSIDIDKKHLERQAEAYMLLGEINFELQEYQQSYTNYNKALEIYNSLPRKKKSKNSKPPYELYYLTAKAAELAQENKHSLELYQRFLDRAPKKIKSSDIIKTNIGMGNVYLQIDKMTQAEEYYTKALSIAQDIHDVAGMAEINLLLGQLAMTKEKKDEAIQLFELSKQQGITTNSDQITNQAYTNLSAVYHERQDLENAITTKREALDYNEQRNNTVEINNNTIALANLLIDQNKNEEAIDLLTPSISSMDSLGDLLNKTEATKALSEAYKNTGDQKKSNSIEQQYLQLEDSIKKVVVDQMIIDGKRQELLQHAQDKLSLLTKDQELNEKTIELLQKEQTLQEEKIHQQNTLNYALIIGFILLSIASVLIYRSNKEKNKANQLLELKSLRAQMNPHFIFNSLNSVNNYISNNDEIKANKYLTEFSRLMRDVMENSQEDFITLAKEISIIELYLKLEHSRFSDKFDYVFEVDPAIHAEETTIPPMLIQPYIENAIWHGLRYKKEKGLLQVRFQKKDDRIHITIMDDGIGRKKSRKLKTKNQIKQKSTGLKNIDSRLAIIKDLYKTDLDISIEDATQEIEPGTRITIKLALHKNTET